MPEKPKIKRAKDQYGGEGDARDIIDLYREKGSDVTEPVATVAGTLNARVDHGRWIVDCSDCNNAQLVGDEDLRFFCVKCENAANGGQWREIIWPSDAEEIEDVLAVRPTENRHWRAGETVSDLKTENVGHGLPEMWEVS